jgi:hypothetical protein
MGMWFKYVFSDRQTLVSCYEKQTKRCLLFVNAWIAKGKEGE